MTARDLDLLEALERYFPLKVGSENFTGLGDDWFDWDSVLNVSKPFVKECTFRGLSCSMKNFTPVYTDMGICYTFNSGYSGHRLTSDSSGRLFGLQLTLDVDQRNYFRGFAGYGAGFKVRVHARDPPMMSNMGFSVGAGMHTLVGLKMINVSNLDVTQWGSCRKDITLKFHPEYSQSACRRECLYDFMIEKCQCVKFLKFGKIRQSTGRFCNPKELFYCYGPNYDVFIQKKGQCKHVCPVACESIKYEVSLSQVPFADYYAEEMINDSGYRDVIDFKKNTARLDIFFMEISYERREQYQAYNAFTLGCDIGGALGLILGASVLTLFEVGDFIILMVLKGKGKKLC
ncbi:acid-sensing ion channel 1C-like [Lingula anatina]|uniref:Acid-sensing ion channel 1C-like n=1 Tax=Lingula anatina TaxID=7574 RepID=A0A1S3IV88_LINAN|nr:acid-sensing ion channel 1C-like [Lingula anatina]|eukprot:XP_013401983.1 acid-sensing ion channel 1C-like [Lingula anatina]